MSVVSVKELYTRTSEINEKGQRSYTRTFQVITDDQWTGPAVVREAVGIAVGDTYLTSTEYDDYAYCLSKSASCTAEDGKQWTVTVAYGPPPETDSQNPLNDPPEITWSFSQFQRPAEQTRNGEAIVNVCGDPFANEISRDDSRPILSITRNEAFFSAALAYLYRDCVNSDSFMGASAGQAKVSNISSTRQFNPNFGFYWKTSYEFSFDAAGYEKQILNIGLRERDQNTGQIKHILKQGVPITEPVLLDQQGRELPSGNPPHFLKFPIYFEVPFAAFNF